MDTTTDHGQDAIDRFKVMLNSITLNTPKVTKIDEQIDLLRAAVSPKGYIAEGVDSAFILGQLDDRREALYDNIEDCRYRVCMALTSIPKEARQEIAAIVERYQSENASPSGVA